jgi:hypothetical protein
MTIYSGLLRASVYDANGVEINNAHVQFWDEDPGLFMEIIHYMTTHVQKYIHKDSFQAGFGSDNRDGYVFYAHYEPIQQIPEMNFEASGKNYFMRFDPPSNPQEIWSNQDWPL